NDGDYLCLIETTDPLPSQGLSKNVALRQEAAATKFEVKRGVKATVTVTDSDGVPLAGAKVIDVENEQWLGNLQNMRFGQGNMFGNQFPMAETDEKGVAVLEKIGMHPIHLIAVKDGYDLAVMPDKHWEDGGTIENSIKLTKTKPVHAKIQLTSNRKKGMAETRVLLVSQAKQIAVVGMQWFQQLNVKDIDTYIQNGAIDFKTTDDKGAVAGDALPDQYMVFCFAGGKAYYGNLTLQSAAGDVACNVNLQELQALQGQR
ncbi:MAG TPA: hypothetical protein VL860_06450, partial [Planctomycetota bacterium]|nr:hypothetical protein [Planctomycetota bacterium]